MADTCVSRVPVFAGLSAHDQHRIAGLAHPTRLRAGEVAYSADEDLSQLIVLHTGRMKIFRLSANGAEQLIRVLGPGEFTGETSVFTGQRPDDYATALDDCQVCVIRHDDLEALVRQHPEIGLRTPATVSERLADTEHRLNSLTRATSRAAWPTTCSACPAPGRGCCHGHPAAGQEGCGLLARHVSREPEPGAVEPCRAGPDRDRHGAVGLDHAARTAAEAGRRGLSTRGRRGPTSRRDTTASTGTKGSSQSRESSETAGLSPTMK